MSTCQHPTAQQMASQLAPHLSASGVTDIFQWLVERYGPVLAEILLDLLLRRSQSGFLPTSGAAPTALPTAGFDVRGILVVLLERYGKSLLDELAKFLDTRTDLLSKLLANVLRQNADQFLDFVLSLLKTNEALTIIDSAVAVKP